MLGFTLGFHKFVFSCLDSASRVGHGRNICSFVFFRSEEEALVELLRVILLESDSDSDRACVLFGLAGGILALNDLGGRHGSKQLLEELENKSEFLRSLQDMYERNKKDKKLHCSQKKINDEDPTTDDAISSSEQ
jgi:hypothetical protein